MTFRIQGMGWRRDKPDARDHHLALRASTLLPLHVDLRHGFPAPYQQGNLGSCTGNGIAAVMQFDLRKMNENFMPSRLMIYYNERVVEGSVNEDAGAEIRDGIKVCAQLGACSEMDWPYIESKFAIKPSQKCYDDAAKHKFVQYARVSQNVDAMKACLAAGYPFVFGFSVYESFESDRVTQTGMVPMPDLANESIIGGHCVVCCGYTSKGLFIVRNSWGTNWGDGGYCYMPFAFLADPNICSDLWMVTALSG